MKKFLLFLFSVSWLFLSPLPAEDKSQQFELQQEAPAIKKEPVSSQKEEEIQLPKEFEEELEKSQQGNSRFYDEFMNMLFYLAVTLVLMMGVLWVLKRMVSGQMTQTNQTNGINILEKRVLSAKTTIYVLEIYGKAFAIAESANGVASLEEFEHEEEAEKKNDTPPFQNYLEKK